MLSFLTTSLAKKRHRPDEQALSQTIKTIFSFFGGNVSVECFKLNWRSFFDGAYLYTLLIPRMGRCDISSKKYKRNQRGFGEKLRAIPCDLKKHPRRLFLRNFKIWILGATFLRHRRSHMVPSSKHSGDRSQGLICTITQLLHNLHKSLQLCKVTLRYLLKAPAIIAVVHS